MLVTRFATKDTKSKIPLSPYDDLTFDFETLDLDLEQIVRVMVDNFILTIPLKESTRCKRRKTDLSDKTAEHLDYLVLDLDRITSQASLDECLRYFKQYKCILLQSRSFNGIDNFNVKGILACDLETKFAKFALSKMHRDLEEFCDLDEAMARCVSTTAPINKYKVLLNNKDHCKIFTYSNIDVGYVPHGNSVKVELPKSINEARTIPELCLRIFTSMGFTPFCQDNDNGVLRFKHTSEAKTPGGFFWFPSSPYRMNHFNASRTIDIFNDVKNLAVFKQLYNEPIDYAEKLEPSIKIAKTISVNTSNLAVTSEINDAIDEFIESQNGTLCIKSAMGTGKSVLINHIIKQAHEKDMRVLIITNRISVAEDFASKYNLKIYSKDKYQLGDSLICQYDSLRHYSLRYFDVIIMDEFVSLLLHSRNNLSHDSANAARFYSALARKVVIADAFINNFVLRLVPSPITMVDNTWRDDTEVRLYSDFNLFAQTLLRTAKAEKITVSCTSLNVINALQLLLENNGLKVCTLTSGTPSISKEKVYEYFSKDDAPWDVLIFSPTLTVGVSNLNEIKHHFHYDSSMSNDVISSAQMCKRTRKAKIAHVHIKARSQVLKTEYDDLKSFYMNHSVASEDNFMFALNPYGELKLSKLGKKAIAVDQLRNVLEVNHKDALLYILKMHFKGIVGPLRNVTYQNVLNPYLKMTKENEKELLRSNIEQFKRLNHIDADMDQQAMKLIEDTLSQVDASCPVKGEILEAVLKDKTLVVKCQRYKMLKDWCEGGCGSDYYRTKMSNLILHQNNPELLNLCSLFAKLPPMQYQDSYPKGKLNNSQVLLLKKCGFSLSSLQSGIRAITVEPNVKKYSEWII